MGRSIMQEVCVIIPAFNEAKTIGQVVKKCREFIKNILVIDDGSIDNTGALAQKAGGFVVRHNTRMGKGASLISGFRWAIENNFKSVITLDADAQHNPEDIHRFLKKSEEGWDMLIGNRMFNPKGMPLIRYLTNRITSRIVSRLSHQYIPDSQCGYRFISTSLLQKVLLNTIHYDQESEILIEAGRNGFRIGFVEIKTIYNGAKSTINPFLDAVRFFNLVLKYVLKGKPMGEV
jgi:glycosyltransferase involved in cell wall biosynthesis